MSFLKSIKKVFKKTINVVGKVAPIALAVGAVYFTAGAALGAPGTAGGWGGAVDNFVKNQLGATGTLANVLVGATQAAGYGAVVGAVAGGITGQGVIKGAQYGALGGAAVGGALGAAGIGLPASANPNGGLAPDGLPNSNPSAGVDVSQADVIPGAVSAPAAESGGLLPVNVAAPVAVSGTSGATGLSSASQLVKPPVPKLSLGDRLANALTSDTAIGTAAAGLGTGLLAFAGSAAEADATKEAAKLKADQFNTTNAITVANYSNPGAGLLNGAQNNTATPGSVSPMQRFDQSSYRGQLFRFDPASGRLVQVAA